MHMQFTQRHITLDRILAVVALITLCCLALHYCDFTSL